MPGREQARQHDRRAQVHLEHLVDLLRAQLRQLPAPGQPGVRDQHVHVPGRGGELLDLAPVGQVAGNGLGAELLRERLERVDAPAAQDERRPASESARAIASPSPPVAPVRSTVRRRASRRHPFTAATRAGGPAALHRIRLVAEVAWRPTPEYVENANVTRLMRAHGIESIDELRRRSVEDIAWFWDAVVKDIPIDFSTPYEQVVDDSAGIPWAKWFVGGHVNLTHNCVDRHAAGDRADVPAVIGETEDGEVHTLTYASSVSPITAARSARSLAA